MRKRLLKKIAEKIRVDIPEWYSKLPKEIQSKIESIVDSIDRSELTAEEESNTVKKLQALIPEYPYYHWHWTILPKTSVHAGFELGAGMEISTIEPEKAAEYLRKQ